MPLAALIAIPNTEQDLQSWMFANQASHRDINRRVFETRRIKLPEFVVAPFDPKDQASLSSFLANNWAMHTIMDQVLGITSNPLNAVNWNDPDALAGWIFTHYTEHQAASRILGIG